VGDVGRDGAREETTGCGWRRRKGRRGGDRYLFRFGGGMEKEGKESGKRSAEIG